MHGKKRSKKVKADDNYHRLNDSGENDSEHSETEARDKVDN